MMLVVVASPMVQCSKERVECLMLDCAILGANPKQTTAAATPSRMPVHAVVTRRQRQRESPQQHFSFFIAVISENELESPW
jgi:hypothetical protein